MIQVGRKRQDLPLQLEASSILGCWGTKCFTLSRSKGKGGGVGGGGKCTHAIFPFRYMQIL